MENGENKANNNNNNYKNKELITHHSARKVWYPMGAQSYTIRDCIHVMVGKIHNLSSKTNCKPSLLTLIPPTLI